MSMRKTAYARIRYPWTSDVVAVGNVQSMASDIDQALISTAKMGNDFSKFGSVVVKRVAAQSITKATLTAITFDTVALNNGANSPLANGAWWAAGAPTRLTAPAGLPAAGCVVLVSAQAGINFTAAGGVNGAVEVVVGVNGGVVTLPGSKFNPLSAATGSQWTAGMSLWKMNAGDFLEMKVLWTGTPVGPLNTDTAIPPTISLAMVSLLSVP
jgi:hypothetical protein